MSPYVSMFLALLASTLLGGAAAEGSGLRGDSRPASAISWEASPFAVSSLLLELEGAMGSGHRREVQKRLGQIEEELLPTFTAMHKNAHGNLGHTGVRYVLHRYFMQKYSWLVKGLDTAGQAWNVSSPVELLRSHVPASVLESFERRLGGQGFGVRDAAVLAATLESLIQSEAGALVEAIYQLQGLPARGNATAAEVDGMLDVFLAAHVLQVNLSDVAVLKRTVAQAGGVEALGSMASEASELTASEASELRDVLEKPRDMLLEEVADIYPAWPETQRFMRDVRNQSQPLDGMFTFPMVMGIVGQVLDKWGRWRNHECQNTKRLLLQIEDRTTGCVRLADFYRSKTERGVWQFSESVKYLKQQGILEDSTPGDPHVIIPNYLTSQGNCISSSQYYSACCLNECENVLDSLEMQFGAPYATPAEIVAGIARLPSASLPRHQPLSAELLRHLDEIAGTHAGRVPLHGRLFSQWMHHLYPRECPYPHLSGTTHQESLWEMEDQGALLNAVVNTEQAEAAVRALPNQSLPAGPSAVGPTCVPWHHVEELIVHPHAARQSLAALEHEGAVWTATSLVAMASVFTTMVLTLMQLLRRTKRAATATASLPKLEV